ASSAFGAVIDLSTSTPANWTVTGGGAVNAPAYAYTPLSGIAITSNAFAKGTFASGGSNVGFNGFWYADAKFQLPANATSIALTFTNLLGDDRVVLQLNGVNIGDYFLNNFESNPPLTGPGVMSFPPGPPDGAYTFTDTASGVINSGFILGGQNDLRLVLNNTASDTL